MKTTKKDFVLKFPTLSASEIVKKATEESIKLTEAYVYNVRSAVNRQRRRNRAMKSVLAKTPSIAKATTAVSARPSATINYTVAPSSESNSNQRAYELLAQAISLLVADRVRTVLAAAGTRL